MQIETVLTVLAVVLFAEATLLFVGIVKEMLGHRKPEETKRRRMR